jgi:hypothetical protein
MIFGYFGCIYLTWIYTAWLPGYLEIERHMSVKYTGWLRPFRSPAESSAACSAATSPTSWCAVASSR